MSNWKRFTIAQERPDDIYSWAVLDALKPIPGLSGLTRSQAIHYRSQEESGNHYVHGEEHTVTSPSPFSPEVLAEISSLFPVTVAGTTITGTVFHLLNIQSKYRHLIPSRKKGFKMARTDGTFKVHGHPEEES
jgi:hypothetical protein